MSRRAPDPAAERAARNTQTIKSLLKLEVNKSCADCKRNKHPRWASWNLGIFVCIRCSGIHRGMGTHISRVKSVDLDAWTDEQLQSVLIWGNARANKYWEAKLAPGHVPSEAKIENFIRTKYESKRWVMDGPIPDPSSLDAEGDDDIPLNLVKEKHNIERSASQKTASSAGQITSSGSRRRAPQPDLFGDDSASVSQSNVSATRVTRQPPPPEAEPAPPRQTKPADSLLGLDFFGTEAPPPNRPSSGAAMAGASGQSRPDLKQSILSLYATAPRPPPPQQAQPASQGWGNQGVMGGVQSAATPQQPQQSQSSFGAMNDAFGGLNFGNPAASPVQGQPKPNAFAGLGNVQSHKKNPSSGLGGGSFFNAKPAQNAAPTPPLKNTRTFSNSSGFGDFGSAPGASLVMSDPPATSSGLGDLFDFSAPAAAPQPPPKQTGASPPPQQSVFNLSTSQAPPPQAKPQPVMSGWNNNDAWGSNDAWGANTSAPGAISPVRPAPPIQSSSNDFGWGSAKLSNQSIVPGGGGFSAAAAAPPKVAADEDFGGWSSAAPVTPGAGVSLVKPKPANGFATSEDLFSNVWE